VRRVGLPVLWSLAALTLLGGFSPEPGANFAHQDAPVTTRTKNADLEKVNADIAAEQGWLSEYQRGKKILQTLASITQEERQKLAVTAYRGESVAFVGAGAPPGATNDLLIGGGYYLRVVTGKGKDLRPRATKWEILVRGKILQVLPENKIIVLQVAAPDWRVIETL
jgi:hypothetical protein